MTPEQRSILREGRPTQQKKLLASLSPSKEKLSLRLLRTCTVEGVVKPLQLAMALQNLDLQVSLGDFGALEGSFEANADVVWVWWRLEDLAPRLVHRPLALDDDERKKLLEAVEGRVRALLKEAADVCKAPVFFSTFVLPPGPMLELVSVRHGPFEAVQLLNRILQAERSPSQHLLPLAEIVAREGLEVDRRMDLYGRLPLAVGAWGPLADGVAPFLLRTRRARRKVIAVDADNTLWGGVLGEDGYAHCQCGTDHPGNVFLHIQWRLLECKASGLLLVLLSKNDLGAVTEAFEKMPGLALRLEDFVEVRCSYGDKWQALGEVAAELDLGVDAFAFIDDAPFEREQMAQFQPQVLILNQSSDPVEMLESLNHPELSALQSGSRDQHGQYLAQKERKELQSQSQSQEDFLRSLGLKVRWSPLNEALLPRAVQMLQKTNQFNLTTKRHGESQLREWMEEGHHLGMIQVEDRFGDQGWVGLLIGLKKASGWEVDSLLMSCRVLGRGVEGVLWSEFLKAVQKSGATEFWGHHQSTERNGLVEGLYPAWGGVPLETDEEGCQSYRFEIAEVIEPPTDHIERIP